MRALQARTARTRFPAGMRLIGYGDDDGIVIDSDSGRLSGRNPSVEKHRLSENKQAVQRSGDLLRPRRSVTEYDGPRRIDIEIVTQRVAPRFIVRCPAFPDDPALAAISTVPSSEISPVQFTVIVPAVSVGVVFVGS